MATKTATTGSSSKATPETNSNGKATTKKPPILAGDTRPANDATRRSFLAQYEGALKLMSSEKFDKAHEAFTKLLPDAPADIAPSIRNSIQACEKEMQTKTVQFSDPEERYDYAISLLNHGHYEDAREHFEAILKSHQNADYAFYGMALLAAMTCDSPRCIEHLAEAIRLNPQNRLQARNDSDFESVADDPSFTELLYPEP
jgi:tetratricopeptide (TPR) repeat protein